MRKTQLPRREVEICARLRKAREFLGLSQEACAAQIGIERTTLANYEYARTPVRYEIGFRFCRQLVISEEWLATGKFAAMQEAAAANGLEIGSAAREAETIFLRQCMDLLSEPIFHTVPPGTLFSKAYDEFFAARYAELATEFFYTPRIVFADTDKPQLGSNLLSAFLERWFKLLSNEALRLHVDCWLVQRNFIRALFEIQTALFGKFIELQLDVGAFQKVARHAAASIHSGRPRLTADAASETGVTRHGYHRS